MPKGVYPRQPAHVRFWAKVNKDGPVPPMRPDLGPCWLWTACISGNGYGHFNRNSAHRWSYIEANGPIPKGLEPDHLCRNRRCVRPTHLEAVTHRENVLRGQSLSAENAAKTNCPQGHAYSGSNLKMDEARGIRLCRICCNRRTRNWKIRTRYKVHAKRPSPGTESQCRR